jgi:hypothetical protein
MSDGFETFDLTEVNVPNSVAAAIAAPRSASLRIALLSFAPKRCASRRSAPRLSYDTTEHGGSNFAVFLSLDTSLLTRNIINQWRSKYCHT